MIRSPIRSFSTHRAGVPRRAQACGVEVLPAIQDTTTFSFDTRKSLEGLGSIGRAVRLIGRLGGHLGRKGDGPPRSRSPLAWPSQTRSHHRGPAAVSPYQYLWIKIGLSLRKASLGWELLASLLPEVLRPLADPALHPDSFHKGLRPAAIDGVHFNLRNTAAINANT